MDMVLARFLREAVQHIDALLIGQTLVLSCGGILMLFTSGPLHRQRLGELTIGASLLWMVLALLPLPKIPSFSLPTNVESVTAQRVVSVGDSASAELPMQNISPRLVPYVIAENKLFSEAAVTMPVTVGPDGREAVIVGILGGACFCSVWLTLGALFLYRLRRTSHEPAKWLRALFDSLCSEKTPIRLCVSDRCRRPICFGVFRPVILLPREICQRENDRQLRHILLHELAHVRQRDAVGNLVLSVALPLLCLHPLYWWISARLRMAREVVADSWAASHCDKNEYVEDLIALSRSLGPAPIGAMGTLGIFRSRSRFFRRMKMLVERQTPVATNVSKRWSTVALLGFSLGALLLASVCGLDFATAEDEKPPVAETKKQVEKPMSFDKQTDKPEKIPPYRIGPSDILLIDGVRMAPKAPYIIHTMDVLQIQADGVPEDQPLGGTYQVMPGGQLNLGPNYGSVLLKGKSVGEAQKTIGKHLQKVGLAQPTVSVTLIQVSGIQAIQGEHLVNSDGTVTLGMYGRVYVAGLTIDEARAAMEQHLSKYLETPIISISPFAINSEKHCYVVTHTNRGAKVSKVTISHGTTILDVLSQIEYSYDKEVIQLVRPVAGNKRGPLHSIKWVDLVYGDKTQNHRVRAGDIIHMHGKAVETKTPEKRR